MRHPLYMWLDEDSNRKLINHCLDAIDATRQGSPSHRTLPTKGSPTLQQEYQGQNFQNRGLGTTPSLPKHQRRRSRQARPQLGRTLQDHQDCGSRSLQTPSSRRTRHPQQLERHPSQAISFLNSICSFIFELYFLHSNPLHSLQML